MIDTAAALIEVSEYANTNTLKIVSTTSAATRASSMLEEKITQRNITRATVETIIMRHIRIPATETYAITNAPTIIPHTKEGKKSC